MRVRQIGRRGLGWPRRVCRERVSGRGSRARKRWELSPSERQGDRYWPVPRRRSIGNGWRLWSAMRHRC